MPRRRKSVHSNKAPLIFTESPVNKQSNVPSPIYCARHPLTAKSVPVEDLHDLTWVCLVVVLRLEVLSSLEKCISVVNVSILFSSVVYRVLKVRTQVGSNQRQ